MASRSPADDQLNQFQKSQQTSTEITTGTGSVVGSKTAAVTVGPRGPMLLQDFVFIDEMAHFARERIPERVGHAKAAGAFGEFEVTHDVTKYTKAGLFSQIGKKTPLLIRLSTVIGEKGSADTVRDPRGFAIKFYTEEGNYDLVGNNTPIFFFRDPTLAASFVHSQKRNPATHLKNADMAWDFISLRPETIHQILFMFSDRGIPDGFRHINGYGSHTFKWVNKDGEGFYIKYHFKTDQGIKNLSPETAQKIAGTDPDYAIRDLYNAIARKEYPSWTLYIQIITQAEGDAATDWNPFDVTKVWPQKKYPLIPVGKMTLNRNPKNYFTDVEQAAFSPAHFVPGIEPSPDRLLQGRLFAYDDTQRHRLGANFMQLPVNCPYNTKVNNYQRDGPMNVTNNQDGAPNYYPNSFSGPIHNPRVLESSFSVCGIAKRYEIADEDNYSQPRDFYQKVLKPEERNRLAKNIADLLKLALPRIQDLTLQNFSNVDPNLSKDIKDFINAE